MSASKNVQSSVWQAVQNALQPIADDEHKCCIVAVSGGVDSMVLLHAAHTVCSRHNVSVVGVHVNHHIRAGAGRDATFVQQTCAEWGIPAVIKDVYLEELEAEARNGVEADARTLRYRALTEEVERHGASMVLLGHHGDDQVETVLWRLVRGTSLTGLSGMQAEVQRNKVLWVRPLLPFSKGELGTYAAEHEIPHVEDETNTSIEYTRNYLRHTVIPQLHAIQPNLHQVIGHMTEVLGAEDAFLESMARQVVARHCKRLENGFSVDLDAFRRVEFPLQRRAIKILLYFLSSIDWTSAHIESILSVITENNPSAELQLAGSIRAKREYQRLFIGELPHVPVENYCMSWHPETTPSIRISVPSGSWEFSCNVRLGPRNLRGLRKTELVVPKVDVIRIRNPEPGDRLRPLGLNGTKKVQDIFVDNKIPRAYRGSWPIFEIAGEIVWVPGIVRSEEQLVSDTEDVLFIRASSAPNFNPHCDHGVHVSLRDTYE